MISARYLTCLVLLSALFVTSCQTTSKIGAIGVTVVDFKPTGSSLLESRAIMTLRFINENLSPVAFSGSTHKLYLNGTYVGKAVNNQAVGLAPISTTTQDVAVFFENVALVNQFARLGQNTEVSYRLTSVLFYQQGDEKDEYDVETNGSIDLAPLLNAGR
ncbi:MAG: LEA type 2 family protein [Cephaloticoccus sp.]|nr:LEA type 2 family protein [Cephaloticoccus sp.]MCF7760326.1 LEA type 2 family protein [Cephaloticoccus sp.]